MVDILNDSQVDVEDVHSWSTLWYRRFYRGVEQNMYDRKEGGSLKTSFDLTYDMHGYYDTDTQ